jgi:hypothetical protein
LGLDEVCKPFAVSAHVSVDFGEGGKISAFGLGDVEHIHSPEAIQPGLILFGVFGRFFAGTILTTVADHWSQNENALFATPDEAAKRVPSAKSGNVGRIRFLPRNQHNVPKAVIAKFGHGREILREHCTVPGLEGSHEEIHGLFVF